ncbi:MAG: T9SS type A sorting domain-containing protein [Saprospiraceae bacterium]|nr:T9SS type A sorting domain-containing protein [Saprospiraceae bacterium]
MEEPIEFILHNIQGQRLLKQEFYKKVSINAMNLTNGIYFL